MASRTVQDYHIGWICALDIEFTAAIAMLDEEHPAITGQDRQDHNSYAVGKVHQHNVVIACMPAGVDGVVSAATVAKDMARTFPELRVQLMVGIGGGIPNLARGVDIRLGDVVVSMPDKTWGGVVQYDHGKAESGGVFVLKGQLNQPPDFLLRTLAQVQARHRMQPSKIIQYMNEAVAKNSMLEDNGFVRPDTADQLMCTACNNNINDTSSGCTSWHQRKVRKSLTPVMHYGIIASGNVVVKDAVMRDRLRDQFQALCVEMEAAGLMNDFPCLVIRGICDYADSSKNDVWHPYAAITAAAYAKEFLFYVSPAQASQEQPIRKIVGILDAVQQATQAQAQALQAQVQHFENDEHRRCHQAFKTSNYEEQKNINPEQVEGTCQWVLEHQQYQQWHDNDHNCLLWISADPGCGKSVLAKSLVDHNLQGSSRHSICYFFFKDNEEQDNVATALCAIVHQLLAQQPRLIHHALAIYDPSKPEKVQQDAAQLWRTFLAASGDADAHDVTCVLDALDECRPSDRSRLIDMLARFHHDARQFRRTPLRARLKFLVTSRPYSDIDQDFHKTLHDLPTIRLRGEEENDRIHREIDLVIQMRVNKLANDLGLHGDIAKRLKSKLLQMNHRTYLWLHLAIEGIYSTYRNSFAPEEESILLLPANVEDAYEKILDRIPESQRSKVRTIFRIIVGSRRPLTVAEMAVALGIAYRRSSQVRSVCQARLDPAWVGGSLRHWCGLFVFLNHGRVYLIHQTAKEFLLNNNRACDSPSGWKHSIFPHEAELEMTRICTDLLTFEDTRSTQQDLVNRLRFFMRVDDIVDEGNEMESLVAYAAEHWPSHYLEAEVIVDQAYVDEVHPLFVTCNGPSAMWLRLWWQVKHRYLEMPRLSALQLAALLGHEQQVAHIVRSMATHEIDEIGPGQNTALTWTSSYGYRLVVQRLLEAGADVNAQGGEYGTALQAAAARGHEPVVRLLLDEGADVNAQGSDYGTALQAAAAGGHELVVQLLLDNGADVNTQGGVNSTALQEAAARGHKPVVRLLLDEGADVNAQGGDYGTALQAAAAGGHELVVQLLLDNGADVNTQGGVNSTALQEAAAGGHEPVVRLLLDEGADVNAQEGKYGTALQAAAARGHEPVVRLLLDKGADVNAQEGEYSTALQAAAVGGHEPVVQLLLDEGADVNAQEGWYGTALQAAAARGHEPVVRLLLDEGADVNAQEGKYGTALQAAAARGHEPVVRLLLDKGADVNAQEGEYSTALQVAAVGGHEPVVQLLLDEGADVNAQEGWYGTALQAAAARGHEPMVQMLKGAGARK